MEAACELGFGQSVSTNMHAAATVANMQEAVYKPILDLLADHKPRTFSTKQLPLLRALQVI